MGGALASLIAGIDRDFDLPVAELPQAVRRRLQDAVSTALFLDVARQLLAQLVSEPDARYLHADPASRYGLEVFCWPPGFGNEPHLHHTWNASAVMAGTLLIFRSSESAASCLIADPLVVTTGQAGLLTPPQFHCLRNATETTAMTLHVFSAGERDDAVDRPALASRFDDSDLRAIADEAVARGGADAQDIVRSAFAVTDLDTKLALMKLMATVDPTAAGTMARTLSQLVGGSDGRRLLAVADQLEARGGE